MAVSRKTPKELVEMCRELTPKAIWIAESIMEDEDAKNCDRLRAVEIILDRAYGKPAQSMTVKTDDIPQVVIIGGDKIKA